MTTNQTADAPSAIPAELVDLFAEPALAHISYIGDKGQIVTFPLWVDFDGRHLVTSSPVGSKKGAAWRARPQAAVSIVSTKSPWHWLTVSGRVVDIRPDEGLLFINKMSQKYTGSAYGRNGARETFFIEVDSVKHSGQWRG